jgi:hypothetical protein
MRPQQIVQSQGRHDVPRVDTCIDNMLGERVRKLCAWHGNRLRAELTHGFADKARLHVDFEVPDVLGRAYRSGGV